MVSQSKKTGLKWQMVFDNGLCDLMRQRTGRVETTTGTMTQIISPWPNIVTVWEAPDDYRCRGGLDGLERGRDSPACAYLAELLFPRMVTGGPT